MFCSALPDKLLHKQYVLASKKNRCAVTDLRDIDRIINELTKMDKCSSFDSRAHRQSKRPYLGKDLLLDVFGSIPPVGEKGDAESIEEYLSRGCVIPGPDISQSHHMDLEDVYVDTSSHLRNGRSKCPSCGASDISVNQLTGGLRCNYCRYEYETGYIPELRTPPSELIGVRVHGSASADIPESTDDVLTLRCPGCGAEVVVNTADATSARCHWCKSVLSVNEQLPNGTIPDAILPFRVTKAEALNRMKRFVSENAYMCEPGFVHNLTEKSIVGVYFPYYVVDSHQHYYMAGRTQRTIQRNAPRNGQDCETTSDVMEGKVERAFDIAIDNLQIEASIDKLDALNEYKTTHVLNAILPYDAENCVRYDANYLRTFSSERRDVSKEQVDALASTQAMDIARYRVLEAITQYDRGVYWKLQRSDDLGERWHTAYFPVWLYSYRSKDVNGQDKIYYIAVNARTLKAAGSVPMSEERIVKQTLKVGLLTALFAIVMSTIGIVTGQFWLAVSFLLLAAGPIYSSHARKKFKEIAKRRPKRYAHETETVSVVSNMQEKDMDDRIRHGVEDDEIPHRNDRKVEGFLAMHSGKPEDFEQHIIRC